MAENPLERLVRQGRTPVRTPDEGFVDRLESHLRVEHAAQEPASRRTGGLLPRIGIALAVVVVGVVGALAFTGRDAGLPVSVIDDEPIAPVDQPLTGDGDRDGGADETTESADNPAALVPTATATPTAVPRLDPPPDGAGEVTEAGPTPTTQPSVEPAAESVEPTPTTAQPAPTSTPASVTSTPTPTPTTVPTATVAPIRPQPVPTATAAPTPTMEPTPLPTPTPTPIVEPATVDMECAVRSANAAVGVVCTWDAPTVDAAVTHYELWRSRNGGEAQVISRQRATAPTNYADRDVALGDELTYLVRALAGAGRPDGEQVVAASVRQLVQVPAS